MHAYQAFMLEAAVRRCCSLSIYTFGFGNLTDTGQALSRPPQSKVDSGNNSLTKLVQYDRARDMLARH